MSDEAPAFLGTLEPATEDDMVELFIRAEIRSSRPPREHIRSSARSHGYDLDKLAMSGSAGVVARQRAIVLGDTRGYGRDAMLFHRFPLDVAWSWAQLGHDELQSLVHLNEQSWVGYSGGTRRAADVAARAMTGAVDEQITATLKSIVDEVRSGEMPPEIVVVSSSPAEKLVVLEGHARSTAYLMALDAVPDPTRVLFGYSPGFEKWVWY